MSRVAGILELKIDGEIFPAKGSFSYNLGRPKREMIVGADRVHGYKEMPQVPFIEGVVTDTGEFDIDQLLNAVQSTVTLRLANGNTVNLANAVFAAEGTTTTEEGEIEVRLEGESADLV